MNVLKVQSDSKESADVFDFNLEFTVVKDWRYLGSKLSIFIDNLNWLDLKLVITLTVFRELTCEDGEDDLALGQVGTSDFDEAVLGVH